MRVEVVFALATRQDLLVVDVPEGATVAEVISISGIVRHFPDQNIEALQAGIWGQPVQGDRQVREGDRVEVYRLLEMDPREARRLKAGV